MMPPSVNQVGINCMHFIFIDVSPFALESRNATERVGESFLVPGNSPAKSKG